LDPNIACLFFDEISFAAWTKRKKSFIEYAPRFQERSKKLGQLLVEN
jgi:hypothetical protein